MIRKHFFQTLILVSSLFISLHVAAQCNLGISGFVFDAETHKPLPASVVSIDMGQQNTLSDSAGRFAFAGVCPGKYNVTVTHTGCLPLILHVHVAQKSVLLDVPLPHATNELKGVTITSYRTLEKGTNLATISAQQLQSARGESLAEAMQKIAGISILQTGSNIYKPVINGLHSNRIIILNNGIRQEGQQWGSEHAPEIDPFIATRITVLRGATTLRYGGDGLGGIVLVEPHLLPARLGVNAEINTGFFTNQRMGYLSTLVEGNSKKVPSFAWRIQGTIKRGGNAKTPNYFLANSGTSEVNFSTNAAFTTQTRGIDLFYSLFNTQLAIFSGSHIGNTTDLQHILVSGNPPDYITNKGFSYKIGRPYQQIVHHLAKAKAFKKTGDIGRLNATLSWQHDRRKEYDIKKFVSSTGAAQLDLGLVTTGLDLAWDHYGNTPLRGTIAANTQYQENLYFQRFFIPNYQSFSQGVAVVEKYELKKWLLEAALRYDYRSMFSIAKNDNSKFANWQKAGFASSVGVNFYPNKLQSVGLNFSSVWRAPAINELYSNGLHHGAARIEKGNPKLKAERANSALLSYNYDSKKLTVSLGTFFKNIDNYIYLQPDSMPQLTIRGAFPSFYYAQVNAHFCGMDASLDYRITNHLEYTFKGSIVRAKNRNTKEWIIQIPADNFENSLIYHLAQKTWIQDGFVQIGALTTLKQTRIPATGNITIKHADGTSSKAPDYAPPPPGYVLINAEIGGSTHIHGKDVSISLSGKNLLNKKYRNYMNAFRYFADEMGINIALKLKIALGGSKHT